MAELKIEMKISNFQLLRKYCQLPPIIKIGNNTMAAIPNLRLAKANAPNSGELTRVNMNDAPQIEASKMNSSKSLSLIGLVLELLWEGLFIGVTACKCRQAVYPHL